MANTVYSFKDLVGTFTHVSKSIIIGGSSNGKIGIGQITVHMANDITTHEISMDGAIIPFVVPIFNGTVSIQCQQTSTFHKFLLNWYSSLKTAQATGTVTNWANAQMILKNTVNATSHYISGISPQINPDKVYSTQGGNVTWSLIAANIESTNS